MRTGRHYFVAATTSYLGRGLLWPIRTDLVSSTPHPLVNYEHSWQSPARMRSDSSFSFEKLSTIRSSRYLVYDGQHKSYEPLELSYLSHLLFFLVIPPPYF